ncbi:MAG: YdcF family protein [Clostridia bacterium]|nr:YdcF family protein [Clostridia bacterium]
MKKTIAMLAALLLMLSGVALPGAAAESAAGVEDDAVALEEDITRAIAAYWSQFYLGNGKLYCYGVDDPASLPISGAHAFVVLGYELKNGEMTEELKGRCDAAAMAAQAFPDSILVCSGGATGVNNPDRHTEAGLMKAYLTSRWGIAPERIFTDECALTTAENAVNTFAILREQGVEQMTIVTSTYHQYWSQVLFNAMAAQYKQKYGYSVENIGNYCYIVQTNPESLE